MKFLATLGFLVISGLIVYIGSKWSKLQLEQIRSSRRGTFGNSLLKITILILTFIQFWLLAQTFPFFLIILLLAASFLAYIIYLFIGAIAGFTLPEKQQKIGAPRAPRWVVYFSQGPSSPF
jgi:hypothetical protein